MLMFLIPDSEVVVIRGQSEGGCSLFVCFDFFIYFHKRTDFPDMQ